jgi:hypothetical protein
LLSVPAARGERALEKERVICRSAIKEVNANEAMLSKILLVAIGLMSDAMFSVSAPPWPKHPAKRFLFIQVFEDDWSPTNLTREQTLVSGTSRRKNKALTRLL